MVLKPNCQISYAFHSYYTYYIKVNGYWKLLCRSSRVPNVILLPHRVNECLNVYEYGAMLQLASNPVCIPATHPVFIE